MGAFSLSLDWRRGNPEPCCFTLRLNGGFMIALINRLNRAETQADKEEFIRGLANLKDTKKPLLVGLVAGYLLTNRIQNKWIHSPNF